MLSRFRRLYDRSSRAQLRVVFLKRSAWDAMDGETLPATLAALSIVLPVGAEIEHGRGITLAIQQMLKGQKERLGQRVPREPAHLGHLVSGLDARLAC